MASSDTLAFAVVQLCSQQEVGQNLSQVRQLSAEAKARGAQVVLLPENFAFMGPEADRLQIAETIEPDLRTAGPIVRALSNLARELELTVIGGGMPETSVDPKRPYNTSVVLGPAGELVARYRKIHLFDVAVGDGQSYRESASTSAGDAPLVAELQGFRVGLSVCYDLRFPELYRLLVDAGAEVLTVPAAFTLMTGKDHWHPLLRARAIESQCYVVAAGQSGEHPKGRRTFGKSCIVDPWGDIIAQVEDGPGVTVAQLRQARVREIRASLPSLAHRVIGQGSR